MTQTVPTLPESFDHVIKIDIVGELVRSGKPSRESIVSYSATSRALVGQQMAFAHVDPDAFTSIGVTINSAITGSVSTVPSLLVGNDVAAADKMLVFGGSQDVFGDANSGIGEGEPLGEWIEVTVSSPDGSQTSASREVFDRVGYVARQQNEISIDKIAPIETVDVEGVGKTYPPLLAIHGLAVVSSVVPAASLATVLPEDAQLDQIGANVHGLHLLRDRFSASFAPQHGYRFFPDRPNVSAMIYGFQGSDPASGVVIQSDLLIRSSAAISIKGESPSTVPGLFAGALAHVAERNSVETGWTQPLIEAGIFPNSTVTPGMSVGRIFELAKEQSITIDVVAPSSEGSIPENLPGSDEAKLRMKTALDAGLIVVVPKQAVSIAGETMIGWWEIDPKTGVAVDRLENGRGATLGGYAVQLLKRVESLLRLQETRLHRCDRRDRFGHPLDGQRFSGRRRQSRRKQQRGGGRKFNRRLGAWSGRRLRAVTFRANDVTLSAR